MSPPRDGDRDGDIHERLHAFVDGELEPAEADVFREHLGTCERCQVELEDVLQLQALGEQLARQEAPPERQAPPPRAAGAPKKRAFRAAWSRRAWLASAVGVSLAATLLLILPRPPHGTGPDEWGPGALALAPSRSLEGRLSWQGTRVYRP
jgi:cellulose synthase operon protein C